MSNLRHATRSQVFTALFNLIKTIPAPSGLTWKTQSQYLRIWDEVPDQPAIFLQRSSQTASQTHAYGATKWQWRAQMWIYYRTEYLKTANHYPDEVTDQLIDNIEKTFQTEPTLGPQTLGGLVVNCWIDGTIYCDNGLNDGQAILVCPISILI